MRRWPGPSGRCSTSRRPPPGWRPSRRGKAVGLSGGVRAAVWPPGVRLAGAGPDGPIRLAGGPEVRVPTPVGSTVAVLAQRWRHYTGEAPDPRRIRDLAARIDAD